MKKRLFILFISIIFFVATSSTVVFASTDSNTSQTSENKVKKESQKIEEKIDSLESIDPSELPDDAPLIEFNSVEEFEKAMENWEKENQDKISKFTEDNNLSDNPINNKKDPMALRSDASAINVLISSWNPFKQMIMPSSITADLNYSYTGYGRNRKFSHIRSVSSHASGIPSNWTQTSHTTSYYAAKKGVKTKINGYYTVGIDIKGVPLGYNLDDTITFKWKIGTSKYTGEL